MRSFMFGPASMRTLLSVVFWIGVLGIPTISSAQQEPMRPDYQKLGIWTDRQELRASPPRRTGLIADASARLERTIANESNAGTRGAIIGALVASPVAYYVGREIYQDQFVDGCIGCEIPAYAAGVAIVAGGALIGYFAGRMFNTDSAAGQ